MKQAVCVSMLLFMLCAAPTARAAVFDPSKAYKTVTTEHFAIHYADELEAVAQRLATIAEEAHTTLSPKYRWKPWGRTQVILTDNNDAANGAASVLPYNWMLIRTTAPGVESPLSTYDNWLRTLFFHEYTHILHLDQTGGIMRVPQLLFGKLISPNGTQPGWVREGLATYEETTQTSGGRGRASFSEMMLRTATVNNQLPKIDQADGLGWRWPGANSQYIYGEKFLQWLVDKYGEEKLLAYNRRVGRSPFFLMVNHHAKRVWGKTFYKLWKEWQAELGEKYAVERAAIEAKGVTPTEPFAATGASLSSPTFSPDGKQLAYAVADYHRQPEIRVRDMATGAERVVRKKQIATQISFSPTGDRIAYSAAGPYKKFHHFHDIFILDLATDKVSQITAGRRATDPDFAPDGKRLVYTVNQAGTQHLVTYDLEGKKETILPIAAPEFTQYAHPRWSPDGKLIAVSQWREGGFRDILLVRPDGTVVKQITNDRALDHTPSWSKDGRSLYFTSDRTGISNIFRYDVKKGTLAQVTNVLTGVFEPTISADGKTLVVQHYTGKGYDLRQVSLPASLVASPQSLVNTVISDRRPATSDAVQSRDAARSTQHAARKYSPFTGSLFLPRFISPNVIMIDDGVLLSGLTGGSDPLRWHNWLGGVTYRTDSKYLGYFGNYFYNRYNPVFDLGVNSYAVDSGARLLNADGTLSKIFEKRLRGYTGVSVPWKQHRFSLQYFLEDRDNLTTLTTAQRDLLNFGRFGGVSATYRWSKGERLPASISTEDGRRLRMNFTITDKLLGGHEPNEQQIFSGDYREYFRLPWAHHVLATRIGGGITWGDPLLQGTFGLGGSLGEGTLAGGESSYYFPLRGLPVSALARTRALLMSTEYRIPLFSPQRGLGTWPIFFNNAHAALFADYGNAWNAGESTGKWLVGNFFLGTGAELRGDFVLGHGLPVTGRLGYGIIVVNRDRLGALKDPLLKHSARNGLLVLQLGTSF